MQKIIDKYCIRCWVYEKEVRKERPTWWCFLYNTKIFNNHRFVYQNKLWKNWCRNKKVKQYKDYWWIKVCNKL